MVRNRHIWHWDAFGKISCATDRIKSICLPLQWSIERATDDAICGDWNERDECRACYNTTINAAQTILTTRHLDPDG